jgi:hypothetical protein
LEKVSGAVRWDDEVYLGEATKFGVTCRLKWASETYPDERIMRTHLFLTSTLRAMLEVSKQADALHRKGTPIVVL